MLKLQERKKYFIVQRGEEILKIPKKFKTKIDEVEIYFGELKVRSSPNPKMAIFFH